MSCPVTAERLGAYVDGELPPEEAAEVAEHLTACAGCAREYASTLKTVRAIREGLVTLRAPDVLRARVRASLRGAPGASAREAPRRRSLPWRAAAAVLFVAALSSGVTLLSTRRPDGAPAVAEEVLASHVRSLMPEHLVDVPSSDQHTVKPWFDGRLDFSPDVPRFDDQGFPLLGGRLDYVHGRPVAVVVYGRRRHVINAFSWPADAKGDAKGDARPSLESRHGYHMAHWRSAGTEHWVVSDLNVAELQRFAALLRRADAGGATPAAR